MSTRHDPEERKHGLRYKIKKNGVMRLLKIARHLFLMRVRGVVFSLLNFRFHCPRKLQVGFCVRSKVRYLSVGQYVSIGAFSSFGGLGEIKLHDHVVLNRNVHIDAASLVEICENTLVGPDCYFVDSNHVMPHSTPLLSEEIESAPINIGKNVWLGRGVTVLSGVTIGDYAVVGAGSVVTKSIASRAVVAGAPARVIKMLSPKAD